MVGFSRKWLRNDQFIFKDDKPCGHCNSCVRNLNKQKEAFCVFAQNNK